MVSCTGLPVSDVSTLLQRGSIHVGLVFVVVHDGDLAARRAHEVFHKIPTTLVLVVVGLEFSRRVVLPLRVRRSVWVRRVHKGWSGLLGSSLLY